MCVCVCVWGGGREGAEVADKDRCRLHSGGCKYRLDCICPFHHSKRMVGA